MLNKFILNKNILSSDDANIEIGFNRIINFFKDFFYVSIILKKI